MASYLIDYFIKNNSNYAYTNMCNLYNFIYDLVDMHEDPEDKDKILNMVKKNLGMSIYSGYISYSNRKGLN